MPDGFSVEATDLKDLGRKLRKAADLSMREIDRALLAVGEEHKAVAIQALSGKSTSIPPTIKVQPIPEAHAVRVTAAGTALAWAFEKGNRDKGAAQGFDRQDAKNWFAHPVYARKGDPRYDDRSAWAEQPRVPFFSVARRMLRRKSRASVTEAWRRGARGAGLKVGDD